MKRIIIFLVLLSLNLCFLGCNSNVKHGSNIESEVENMYKKSDVEQIFIPYEHLPVMSFRHYFDNEKFKHGKQKKYDDSIYTVYENNNSFFVLKIQKETNAIVDFIYISKNYNNLNENTFNDCKTFEDVKSIDESCLLVIQNSNVFSEIILSNGSVLKINYIYKDEQYLITNKSIVVDNYIKPNDIELLIL